MNLGGREDVYYQSAIQLPSDPRPVEILADHGVSTMEYSRVHYTIASIREFRFRMPCHPRSSSR